MDKIRFHFIIAKQKLMRRTIYQDSVEIYLMLVVDKVMVFLGES